MSIKDKVVLLLCTKHCQVYQQICPCYGFLINGWTSDALANFGRVDLPWGKLLYYGACLHWWARNLPSSLPRLIVGNTNCSKSWCQDSLCFTSSPFVTFQLYLWVKDLFFNQLNQLLSKGSVFVFSHLLLSWPQLSSNQRVLTHSPTLTCHSGKSSP